MALAAPNTASFNGVQGLAHVDEDERLRRFGEALRRLRLSIPADTTSLGDFVRLPNRVGKVVSQEEFAEAICVSRCWYGMLEGGRPVRPSVALLDRICNALRLDERRRLALATLGIPAFSDLLSKAVLAIRQEQLTR